MRELGASPAARAGEIRLFPVREPRQLPDIFTQLLGSKAQAAMWLLGQQQLFQASTIALAAQHKLPVMVGATGDVMAGGLVSYANDPTEAYQRTARLVARVLSGAKPSELPVEQSSKFELAINLKTARAVGLKIPPSILLRANRVVE